MGEVLWGTETIGKYGKMTRIPEYMLVHGRNARLLMKRNAGEFSPQRTLGHMQSDIMNNQKRYLGHV